MTGTHLLAGMGMGLRCQPADAVAGATRDGGVQGVPCVLQSQENSQGYHSTIRKTHK